MTADHEIAGKPVWNFWERVKRVVPDASNSFSGCAAGFMSASGRPFIVCAPTEEDLQAVMHEIRPSNIDEGMCHSVSLFSESDTELKGKT